MNAYHLGLVKGTGKVKYWGNGHRADTCVLEARRNVDYLSTDLWRYIGRWVISKQQLCKNAPCILVWINSFYNTRFARLIID